MYLLAGDVGGSKTMLALYKTDGAKPEALKKSVKNYKNSGFKGFESLLNTYLSEINASDRNIHQHIQKLCLSVAGPVEDGVVTLTNLNWHIKEGDLSDKLGISKDKAKLINDGAAIAYAAPNLGKGKDLSVVNDRHPKEGGNIAIIAPGTGLAESFLTYREGRYHAHSTEGSHTDFAPTNPVQVKLLDYLSSQYEHVSYERVCSGIGIYNIYNFFKDTDTTEFFGHNLKEPVTLKDKMASANEKELARIIGEGTGNGISICIETIKLVVSILGAEAGNLALKISASGGVFIGGGIARKLAPIINNGLFLQSFRSKGRMSRLLETTPVYIILHHNPALLGAAWYGFMNL